MNDSTIQVQALYERHLYPHYPLLAKPRWQDGYLGSSLFASHLIFRDPVDPTEVRQFLSIGCGEILPYIIRQWEPSATKLTCVDLSRRSLWRAQFRTALLGRKVTYVMGDINQILSDADQQYLKAQQRKFSHVEAYGVLHHISRFQTTLNLIRAHLAPRGIVRIMIYNSHARDWIWDINRALRQLGLNFSSDDDVRVARKLLKDLANFSPRLRLRLTQMGESSLENNTRFADTFLHPWESRATIEDWFDAIDRAGLRPMALYDRYAELDDLQNPLWRCPTANELTERAVDLRYENNLELWLAGKQALAEPPRTISGSKLHEFTIPVRLRLTMPPSGFGRFTETSELPFGTKLALWQGFLKSIYGQADSTSDRIIRGLDTRIARRLARMGLILPETAERLGLLDALMAPLHKRMTPPSFPDGCSPEIIERVIPLCSDVQRDSRRADLAARRLVRAM